MQLDARYCYFDIHELQQASCEAVGATKCTSFTKLGEGNYNKAFRVEFNDGRKVIAKVPHPNAGPVGFTTASEVATMEFARTALDLPVPKVLAWSADDTNPVGAEYIIMEEAKGTQLHEVWPNLPLQAKRGIIDEIVDIESKMLSVEFERFGSPYFADSGTRDCTPAIMTAGSAGMIDRVRTRFSIGPIVRSEFWKNGRINMPQYQGPWSSATQYLESIAHREIHWIENFADPNKAISTPWQYMSPGQQDRQAHIALLHKYLCAVPQIIPKDTDLNSPRFWHPDFHAGNIFVDSEGHISSIIDWQGAWTSPAFIGAKPPLLLDYGVEILMKLPDDFKQLDGEKREQLRYQVAQSILIHRYETITAKTNPLVFKVMHHPHGQTLKQLEAFAGGTWDNCLLPFQQSLISVESEWVHFETEIPCPYHFLAEELEAHYAEADAFNKSQDLWEALRGILTYEGYTSNETFEQAVEAVENLRNAGLAVLEGDDREEVEKETRWVINLKKPIKKD